jgi:hypothetical protein
VVSTLSGKYKKNKEGGGGSFHAPLFSCCQKPIPPCARKGSCLRRWLRMASRPSRGNGIASCGCLISPARDTRRRTRARIYSLPLQDSFSCPVPVVARGAREGGGLRYVQFGRDDDPHLGSWRPSLATTTFLLPHLDHTGLADDAAPSCMRTPLGVVQRILCDPRTPHVRPVPQVVNPDESPLVSLLDHEEL